MTAITRLMVVDDHEVLRQGLEFMVRNQPDLTVVCQAENGAAAIDRIEAARPDVVLLDLRMPTMDGLETLRRLHDGWPHIPVIVFTMYDDPEYVEEALRAGALGYLLKTATGDELLRAVRAVSCGAAYLQAEVTRPILGRFVRTQTASDLPHLTPREKELLEQLADGFSNKQIARRLSISEATVKGYLRQLFEKLGVNDRAHAVGLALRSRIID